MRDSPCSSMVDSRDGWQTDEHGVSYYEPSHFRNFIFIATFKPRSATATSSVLVRVPEPVIVSGSKQATAGAVITVGNDASTDATTGTLRGVKKRSRPH